MNSLFNDTLQGLLEAVEIEKGNIPLIQKDNMPASTFIVSENKKQMINKEEPPPI